MCRSQSSSFFLIFVILFLSQAVRASATPRYLHSAVYDAAHERILFMGGTTSKLNSTGDVYSLDLSTAFSRKAVNLTTLSNMPTNTSDAAASVGADGQVYVLGGDQTTCSSSVAVQLYNTTNSNWTVATTSGAVPSARGGARAALVNEKILYFGGKSPLSCNSSQYYYNTLYQYDPVTAQWTSPSTSSSPVAEADMTMTLRDDGTAFVIGGQSVASNGKASWVGMSQFASYDANTSSWSYLSATSNQTISSRSGHSSATNGSYTFIYGGALSNEVPQQTFLSIEDAGSSFEISVLNSSNDTSAPSTSLYGHSATVTSNGIMVIAFGLEGSLSSTDFNQEIYLYDTVSNKWIDEYDPEANPAPKTTKSKHTDLAVPIIIPIVVVLIASTLVFCYIKRLRNRRKQSRIPYPVNRLGSFTPESDLDDFEKNVTTPTTQVEQAHLPPWAAMYACQARSNSAPPITRALAPSSVSPHLLDRPQQDIGVQDVQFACPTSPRVFTFTAPKQQLRVVNPEAGRDAFSDGTSSQPPLTPLPITSENDLEHLRQAITTNSDDVDYSELRGLALHIM